MQLTKLLLLALLLIIGAHASRFSVMVNNPSHANVEISVNGSEILHAHSAILALASNSSFFEAVLSDNWNKVAQKQYTIDLSQYDKEIILPVLEYIYTGEVDVRKKLITDSKESASSSC